MESFRTHTGETVTGERLQAACEAVAIHYESSAKRALIADDYPAHVTQETKQELANQRLQWAKQTRNQENLHNFTVWQRVNAELTGECVAFLPKPEGTNHA